MILNGADTLYRSGETKGEHTFFGDDFKIWDKTYSETATIYKSSIASITATPTLSSKLNVAFVLEFLDETQSLIDDVAFLKAKQFNFSGVLYGDLTTALNLKADISKSGTYEGEPTRIVKNLMPRMTLRFQIGLIPFWITMGCDLFAKTKMDYSGELHFEQNLSATYLFEEGVKYMPYSAYQIADKWNRFETSTDFPAPIVSGKASWTGQVWVYPRFYAEVDYILGPSFEIKPYLKANIAAGFKEGEVDITKNYLANTASAQVGIDAAVGVSSFLEDVGVNPDKGMYNLGTIKEWEIFRSPSSIELLSSSVDKVRKGQELKLKYQVYQKNFGDEIPSPFFPIVKVEIPKTGEYYYRFSGTSGQVEFTRIPKSSDEIYYAKVFNADGGVVDEVQFGDGSLPEPTVVTGAATSITPTSALIPLSWESEFTVREVGVYYSTTNAQPTLADKSAKGDMASREVVLNGLEPASHYYARGFVTIDTDTGSEVVMGNVVEFTTPEEKKPAIKVSHTLLDFGSIKKGEKAREYFTISNIGTADLTVKLTKASDAFSIDWTSATITPGAEKKVYVTFAPDKVGSFSSAIKIESNAESGNQKVTLRGEATNDVEQVAKIELSKSELSFGEVKVGESNTLSVAVKNTGTADLIVSVSGAPSSVSLSWKEATIVPNSSKSLSVTYTPKEVSELSSVLKFTSNATNGTKTVNLSGKGVGGSSSTAEYVDLGLSVKWATCNLGATKPEEYGNYYAWGETEPKSEYNWSTYKWGNGYYDLTKYCTQANLGRDGFTDNKTVLDLEDDAAHVALGGSWRMPTTAEQNELRERCTWEWTSINGVNGQKVTGPNGNSIFLPAAGYRAETSLYLAGSTGYCWSSSLGTYYPSDAYYLIFHSGARVLYNGGRYVGLSIRPVTE